MAEPLRNEVSITLAGEERTMRATFAALRNIERDLNTTIIGLMQKMAGSEVGLGDTATIIYRGLQGFGDTRLTYAEVGEAIMGVGLVSVTAPVMEFIQKCMNGVQVGKPQPEEAPAA